MSWLESQKRKNCFISTSTCWPITLKDRFSHILILKRILNYFNKYFVSVGNFVSDTINSTGQPLVDDANYRLTCYFTLQPVTVLSFIRHIASEESLIQADTLKLNLHNLSSTPAPIDHLTRCYLTLSNWPTCFLSISQVIITITTTSVPYPC